MRESRLVLVAAVLLAIPGCLVLFGGIVQLTADHPVAAGLKFVEGNMGLRWAGLVASSPETARAILGFQRVFAIFAIAYAVVQLGVVIGPYRRGERWAWFAALPLPLVLIGSMIVAIVFDGRGSGPGDRAGTQVSVILIGLSLVGLLLPIRSFLGRRSVQGHS